MNVCGIIAEYNPFHNGHLKHVMQTRKLTKCDYVIAVMSGNYVQRGEPAICDKYARTKMALLNGVDVVIELPVYCATASAAYFAGNAIALLNSSGIVNSVCFGSESGDIEAIKSVAQALAREDEQFKQAVKHALAQGMPYPSARQAALSNSHVSESFEVNEPNNILAVEYVMALNALNSHIIPYTVRRTGAHYHNKHIGGTSLASATAIRRCILNANMAPLSGVMPENCVSILREEIAAKRCPNEIDKFSDMLHYIISTGGRQSLQNIAGMSEGLENRIAELSRGNYTVSKLAEAVKTKRYVRTKINRALLHTILTINKENFNCFNRNGGTQYIRVLGFRKQSESLLGLLHKSSAIPVIENLKHASKLLPPQALAMLEKELQTTELYWAALRKNGAAPVSEYSRAVVVV